MHKSLVFLTAVVLLSASSVKAQWDWSIIIDSGSMEPYFINANYGFLHPIEPEPNTSENLGDAKPFQDDHQILRTTDAGASWHEPKDYGGMLGRVRGLYFVTSSRGYAAVAQSMRPTAASSGGIYETLDSGQTWQKISPFGVGYDAVYAVGDTVLATATSISDRQDIPANELTAASGIMRSTDRGKTWTTADRRFQPGFDITGNGQGLVVSGADPSRLATTIAVSTNNGKDWTNYTDSDPHLGSLYIPAGSQFGFGACAKGIRRSKDGGKTWEWCYSSQSPHHTVSVDGSGCVVYAQTTGGIFRSTDWGDTWKEIGGPGNWGYKGISVVGNGAVVYAEQNRSFYTYNQKLLFRTTTGGDFTLSPILKGETVTVAKQLYSSNATLSRDTIRTKLCDSAALRVQFNYNSDCNYAWLKEALLDGLSTDQYVTYARSNRDNSGRTDSAFISIHPTVAGTYNLELRVRFEQDDWQIRDTIFPITLIVEPNPSIFALDAKKTFDMGFQRLCNVSMARDSFSISAFGCEPYDVKSVRFEDGSANSGYTFSPSSALTLTPDGSKRYFHISFLPNRAGQFDGKIIIERVDGSDTLFVTARAEDDDRDLLLKSDIISAQACESSEALIDLTNTSCRLMTLDGLDVPAPLEFLPSQLPIGIPAGKSVQVKVRYTPIVEGPQQIDALAHLKFVGQNETIAFDTILPLNVLGLPGTPLTVTTDTTINIGDVSTCSDKTFLVPIQSLGCDTLSISSALLAASGTGYSITAMPAPLVPMNESTTAALLFIPPSTLGVHSTELIIKTNAGTRKFTLIANVIPGTRILASSFNTINFPETNICEERDSVVRLTNNGCDTLTITGADVDKNFSVGGNYPIVLAPGESIDVPITTMVDTAGKPTVLTGTLAITSTADNQIAPITLTRSLYYPTKLRIESVNDASGKQGDVVKFRVLLEGEVPATMTALHFDFLHNGDLLSWDQYDGVGLNRTNMIGDEQQRSSFTLSPVHDGVVGEFSFKTNLARAEQTTLSFDNIAFDAAGVSFAPECIAVISDSGSRFNYIYTCGDNIIRDRLNGTRLIKLITPNPASEEIRLELNATDPQIAIVDMLGAEVLRSSSNRIDVSKLPSGTYYVRVSTPTDIQTKRVVISR